MGRPGKITGEYWIIDGSVDFADGDIGDVNHEGIATSHIVSRYVDELRDIAEEMDLDTRGIKDYDGYYDTYQMNKVIEEIHERLTLGDPDSEEEPDESTLLTNEQAHAWIMQRLGCDESAYDIMMGSGDARLYAMQYEGWIAIRSNNVELYGYSAQRQREIADAVMDVLAEEGQEYADPSETEISIYDNKTGRSWTVTVEDLMRPEVNFRPNQMPTTTYNKSMYHLTNPQDSEENKYSGPSSSHPNQWTQAAKNAGIIGPGQDLWRGTSEVIHGFANWLKLREGNQ